MDGTPTHPGFDVVSGVAEQHRRLDDLCPHLLEVNPRLDATDELFVSPAAHVAKDVHRLGQAVASPHRRDRELPVLQFDCAVDDPFVEGGLREEDAVFHARPIPTGYTSARRMGVLEATARIVQLGGAERHRRRAAEMREGFVARTGAFSPEDPWFEERSRAFWCDAVTRGRFGREVEGDLSEEDRAWLAPLERAHRGLFRRAHARANATPGASGTTAGAGEILIDAWSGAELAITTLDDESRTELDAASGQLFDASVVGSDELPPGCVVALLPGAVFHPRHATAAIEEVLKAARAAHFSTHDTLDALLRMERQLRALSRVKANYAYRPEALSAQPAPLRAVRRAGKGPT